MPHPGLPVPSPVNGVSLRTDAERAAEMLLCIHESGHAVVARAFGIEVTLLDRCTMYAPVGRDLVSAVISAAGDQATNSFPDITVAAASVLREAANNKPQDDSAAAYQAIVNASPIRRVMAASGEKLVDDDAAIKSLRSSIGDDADHARAVARAYLSAPHVRERVLRLACVLLIRGSLTGPEIDAILDDAAGPNRRHL